MKLPSLPVMEEDLVPKSVLTRGALGRLGSPPACPNVGEPATHRSSAFAHAGVQHPAWTQSEADGQGHTRPTPGPAHGARNTFLNHTDRKGLTHLPHQVNISIQEML